MKGIQALAAAALLACATAAHAERYRVDLIVFLDQSAAAGESPVGAQPADVGGALEPGETARLRALGIEMLPAEAFGLGSEWQRLSNSKLQEPIIRLAWLQKDPPAERGPAIRVRWGAALPLVTATGSTAVYPVDGTVSLLAGRYLHLDTSLAHTQRGSEGALVSFRLQERRRVRRNELHHLDSPRLGVLVKVQKAEKPAVK